MSKLPYIENQETSIWGEEFDEGFFQGDPNSGPFELKGYSDKRREQDIARSKGDKVQPLANRFQFVRCTNGAGQPDQRKIAEFRQKGYSLVDGIKQAQALGLDITEADFSVNAEGMIQSGDQVLMFTPAKRARALEMHLKAQVDADASAAIDDLRERAAELGTKITSSSEEVTDGMAADKSDEAIFGKRR